MNDESLAPIARPRPLECAGPATEGIPVPIDDRSSDATFVRDPDVERLIAAKRSIAEIAQRFRQTNDGVAYVERSFARRFPPDAAGDRCIACGHDTLGLIRATWQIVDSRDHADGGVGPGEVITSHACCDVCADRMRATDGRPRGLTRVGV